MATSRKASTPADLYRNLLEEDPPGVGEALCRRGQGARRDGAGVPAGTRLAGAGVHCDCLVALSREAAKEATETAAMHKQLAGDAVSSESIYLGRRHAVGPAKCMNIR